MQVTPCLLNPTAQVQCKAIIAALSKTPAFESLGARCSGLALFQIHASEAVCPMMLPVSVTNVVAMAAIACEPDALLWQASDAVEEGELLAPMAPFSFDLVANVAKTHILLHRGEQVQGNYLVPPSPWALDPRTWYVPLPLGGMATYVVLCAHPGGSWPAKATKTLAAMRSAGFVPPAQEVEPASPQVGSLDNVLRDAGDMEVRPPKGHMSGQSSGQCDVGIGCLEEAEDVLGNLFGVFFNSFVTAKQRDVRAYPGSHSLWVAIRSVSLSVCATVTWGRGGH